MPEEKEWLSYDEARNLDPIKGGTMCMFEIEDSDYFMVTIWNKKHNRRALILYHPCPADGIKLQFADPDDPTLGNGGLYNSRFAVDTENVVFFECEHEEEEAAY